MKKNTTKKIKYNIANPFYVSFSKKEALILGYLCLFRARNGHNFNKTQRVLSERVSIKLNYVWRCLGHLKKLNAIKVINNKSNKDNLNAREIIIKNELFSLWRINLIFAVQTEQKIVKIMNAKKSNYKNYDFETGEVLDDNIKNYNNPFAEFSEEEIIKIAKERWSDS